MKKLNVLISAIAVMVIASSLSTVAAQPINNDCAGAIALNVTAFGAPLDPLEGDLSEVTESGEMPIPGCDYDEGDMWYSAVLPASGYLNIEFLVGENNSTGSVTASVYTGSCGSLTYVGCSIVSLADLSNGDNIRGISIGENFGINPGETILIRVGVFTNSGRGTFMIQAYDPFDDPPANDLCSGAIPFEIAADPCDDSFIVTASTAGALSSSIPGVGCAVTAITINRDIWFSAEIPASGAIEVVIDGEAPGSFGYSVEYLIGSCDDYTVYRCDASEDQSFSLIPGTDFELGDHLFIRSIERTSEAGITFSFLAYEPNGVPPPANDFCADAEGLAVNGVGASLQTTLGCTFGATDSGQLPAPSCGRYAGGDIWYVVEMPASGYLEVIATYAGVATGFGRDVGIEIYSGTCDALSIIGCDGRNESGTVGVGEDDNIEAGELVYIRIWEEENDKPGFFFIAAFDGGTVNTPANDLCADALALTLQDGGCALDYVEGTFVGATRSGGIKPDCASYEGADVWYTVTVPASETLVVSTRAPAGSSVNDTGLSIFSGTCENRIEIECSDSEGLGEYSRIELTNEEYGIMAGQTLLVQLWPSDAEGIDSYWIAAFEPVVAANDECMNATVLHVAQGCDDIVPQEACLEGATLNDGDPEPICGDYETGDIWYEVMVPASGTLVVQLTDYQSEAFFDMEIYSGTCDNLTVISCDEDSGPEDYPSIELDGTDGITAGQTLLVRVWDGAEEGIGSAFIYAFDPSFLPANDECSGATNLPVSLNGDCVPIQACNYGATASPEGPPMCAEDADIDYAGADIWFSMIVPESGTIAAGIPSNLIDNQLALYTGECGNLVEEVCEDDEGTFIGLAGLTPGETVYLRMWPDDNREQSIFEVCAFSAPNPPACTGTQYDQLIVKDEPTLLEEDDMVHLHFTDTPLDAVGGILYISAVMDLDERPEFGILTEEGGTMLAELSTQRAEDCSYTILSVPLTGEQLNSWAADGSIDFMLSFAPEVEFVCSTADTELSARLVYCSCDDIAAPAPATMNKALCRSSTIAPSLANSGVNISNNLAASERVVWVLTGKPDGSTYTVGEEFTVDNCGDPFNNVVELAVANSSKVIRVQDIANAPVGTYTFDAFIEDCVTGCTSELTSGFSLTVNAAPTVEISANPDGDICLNTLNVQYDATITATDGGAYTYEWCAYNSGDGSGTCFGGFDDNTIQAPKRNWVSSAGPKSVGVTVASDAPGCSATDLYSFEVVAPAVLECPANQTATLVTDPMNFDCLAEATFTNPIIVPGPCDPVTLSISVDGGTPEIVVAGESYTAMFQELGVFTVTYDSEDALGNTSTCSFDISVDGLPCGIVDNGGLGCNTSTFMFDQGTETFSLTSDCAPNTMLYTEDQTAFVFTELCGDGEITAQVTGLSGTGFAGVMLRESEMADAKKMALGTNTVDRLRREVRVIDGYPSSAAEILSFNQFWIRVVRSGDTFSAFASADGVFWQPYLSQVIIMEECVLAGLYTYTEKQGNAVTATFTDVSVTGLDNLGAPIAIGVQGFNLESLKIYPNPTNGELNLDLSSFLGKAVDIRLFNSLGQLVYREQIEEVQVAVERLEASRFPAGVYHMAVQVGARVLTERVVVE